VWVAWGCGGCLVVLGLAVGLVLLVGYQTCRAFQAGFEDPAVRAETARRALGTDRLPEGYEPVATISMPLDLFTLVLLADRPMTHNRLATGTERVFTWIDAVRGPEGAADDPERMLSEHGVHATSGTRLASGTLDAGPARVEWEARTGTLETESGSVDGVATILRVRCPQDRRLRVGLWMVRAPEIAAAPDEADLTGTNADPDTIAAFLAPFRLCGGHDAAADQSSP
jgi:hypothetical protein